LNEAGILILPPISDPTPITDPRIASNPPSPPVDPPVVLLTSHGFKALPYIKLLDSIVRPIYGMAVFTNIIPRAALMQAAL
jgi:hypothetical protein